MNRRSGRLTVALLLTLLGGCAHTPSNSELNQQARAMAGPAGLQHAYVDAGPFVLTSFYRLTRADQPLTVYIEGDGFAWRTRREPSLDPTPRKALGLALATADPAPNVVYLARPCQFTPMADNPRCTRTYWTDRRYAAEVVAAMDQALDHYAAQVPGQPIRLVGYSGGAAIAVLLAARRTDIASLRSVAGNLDMAEVNRLHKVSPMPGSLNAIDSARQVGAIPQIHYAGGDDRIVPPVIAQRFASATAGHCAQVRVIQALDHEGDWARLWPALLTDLPTCSPSRQP